MTNLIEKSNWDEVPQIETNTPLKGGPGGALNGQAQALLNRVAALNDALQLPDYAALRAYSGPRKSVYVTAPGIAGPIVFDPSDTTSPDNGGTCFVTVDGRRFKRVFDGAANAQWFGAAAGVGTDNTAAIQAALTAEKLVELTSGSYRVDGTVDLPANAGLLLNNANLIRYAAYSTSTDPVVRLRGNYASISGTGSSSVRSQNESPKGVVALYDPDKLANIAYCKISGFVIGGNSGESSCGVHGESGNHQGGAGNTYFNNISDLVIEYVAYGIDLTANVNATQISSIIFAFIMKAAFNFVGDSTPTGECYANTVSNAWFTNAGAAGTVMHRLRYARWNTFLNSVAEQGGGGLPKFADLDATCISNSFHGVSNAAGGSSAVEGTGNFFDLAGSMSSMIQSWTPVIAGETTAGANTYYAQIGNCIRMGRMVYVQFNIAVNVKDAAMAGNVTITGLPVAIAGGAANSGPVFAVGQHGGLTMPANYTGVSVVGRAGFSMARIARNGSGQAPAWVNSSEIASGFNITGSGFYIAANLHV